MQTDYRAKKIDGPRVFVAMPFGEKEVTKTQFPDDSIQSCDVHVKVKVNFDDVYYELISPALLEAGCKPFRADEEVSAGDIRTDMFFELVTGEFVLADISTLNPNVFYELGVCENVTDLFLEAALAVNGLLY